MTEYRTGGSIIIEQVEALIEDKRFPYKVTVKRVRSENGRAYYSF